MKKHIALFTFFTICITLACSIFSSPPNGTAPMDTAESGQQSTSQPIETIPTISAPTASPLNGTWEGEWTNSTGYLYTCEITLEVDPSNTIDGYITWTMRKSSSIFEQSKIGLTAIEYIRGSYDPQTRLVVFTGYKKDDPNAVIGLDDYKLFLSVDNNTLSGETANHGDWKGVLTAIRKP